MAIPEVPDTQDERFDRYKHLLQPLRDVQANWEGNTTEYLKEYLEKLRLDRVRNIRAEDGQHVKFNFAEAAMLVQNALQIYSRKVDILHSLVTDAYNGNQIKKKKSKRKDDADDEVMLKDEFELTDPKADLLQHQITVAAMIQAASKSKAKDKPVALGNRREPGRRERFVDIPISFVPTRKCMPSKHHFCFEQNNEQVFFQQNDLFNCQSLAVADTEGRDLTLLLNPSYAPLLNKFTVEFIPNLRDDNKKRLRRLPHPYNLEAPANVYEQLVALDENKFVPAAPEMVEVNDHDGDEYGGGGGDDDQPMDVDGDPVGLTNDLNNHRPSSVEGVREAAETPLDGRITGLRAVTPLNDDLDKSLRELGTQLSARRSHLQPIPLEIDVDKELALVDEYQPIKGRLRPITEERSKKKAHFRRAADQIRDRLVNSVGEENVAEVVTTKVTSYVTSRILSRRFAQTGDILGNVNPMLLNRRIRGLNELMHQQQRYETTLRRKQEAEERAAEQQRRRSGSSRRSSRSNRSAARRNLFDEALPTDDFGEQLSAEELDDVVPLDTSTTTNRRRSSEGSQIAELIAAEVESEAGDAFDDSEHPDDAHVEAFLNIDVNTQQTDRVLGDHLHAEAVNVEPEEFDTTLGTFAKGTFVERNEALFDFDEFTKFVSQNPAVMSDNDYLLHSIRKFWSVRNDNTTGTRKSLQQWSTQIQSQLAEEESHRKFDVQYYCSEVLDAFADDDSDGVGTTLKFGRIIRGRERYELSRFLFAVLVLCNCGNVEIDAPRDESGCMMMNRAKIKLLTTRLHSDVFENQAALTGVPAN